MQIQKKIIALAIATAFSASAFAETSIYGILDAGYSSTSTTNTTTAGADTKTGIAAYGFSTMTSSRLGFVHSEDLNDGMKASFKIETAISSNANAGATASISGTPTQQASNGTTVDATLLGSRELNGSIMMGSTTVKLGYGSTLVRDISLGYAPDPGGNLVGNILNADATNLSSNRASGLTVTQGFGAVTGTVQLTANTHTRDTWADNKSGNGYLLGAQYAGGPISGSFAYQVQETVVAAGATATSDTKRKIAILGGSYDLGAAKIIAEYASIKSDQSIGTATSAKRNYLSFGAQAPIGDKALVFAQLSTGKVNNAATGETDRSIKGMTVGAKYNLSKATYGYVSVGNIKQDHDTAAAGYKFDQVALGLATSF